MDYIKGQVKEIGPAGSGGTVKGSGKDIDRVSEFLIIGGDAAGLSAAVQIKRLRPEAKIRVINSGRVISYSACGIPYVISGDVESPDSLIHFTPSRFQKRRGIPVETEQEAVSLDIEARTVAVRDLRTGKTEEAGFHKLLIATGARPIRLPFIDYESEGVFFLNNIGDLRRILAYLEDRRPETAAVIGAGNIGLELTEALSIRGLKVELFDILPFPAGPWPADVRRAVQKKIQEKGVRFHGGTAVKSVDRNGGGFRIITESGEFRAGILFSVVGTRPATDFCGKALDRLSNGALIIDRRGRTSHPKVFAAGDCATVHHRLLDRQVYFPLGSTANKMGRVAGINMAGGSLRFPGVVGTQIFKFFELSLAKTGLDPQEAEKEGLTVRSFSASRTDRAGYYPGSEPVQVRVVCEQESGRLLGASVVCRGNAAQFIDPAAVAVFTGMNIGDLGWFDSAYAPPFAPVWNALISAALKAVR